MTVCACIARMTARRAFEYCMRTQRITPESQMKPATRLTVFAAVVLAGFLLYSSLQAQKATCDVCVSFKGGHNCARASADTAKDAAKSAQTTACGTIAARNGRVDRVRQRAAGGGEVNCAENAHANRS